jgi:hypothetical protein
MRKRMSVKIIEALAFPGDYERMNNTTAHPVLVLGATGKTGSRVAGRLSAQGTSVRTAIAAVAAVTLTEPEKHAGRAPAWK